MAVPLAAGDLGLAVGENGAGFLDWGLGEGSQDWGQAPRLGGWSPGSLARLSYRLTV